MFECDQEAKAVETWHPIDDPLDLTTGIPLCLLTS